MTLFVKNMVCVRCKMIVKSVLENLEIPYLDIELGKVKLPEEISLEKRKQLNAALNYYELELMDNPKKILVESIKLVINEMFHSNSIMQFKFSDHLSKSLNYDYTYLANIFSEMEGSTIEKFFILKKIDRVKELILYERLSIKEISYQLNYTSVSHLSQQFKKITGLTPAKFKLMWEAED